MKMHLILKNEPPFGFTSRLRRETRLQRWFTKNAKNAKEERDNYLVQAYKELVLAYDVIPYSAIPLG